MKCQRKCYCFLILIIFILLNGKLSVEAAANYDKTAPTIESVEVINNVVYAPGTISIRINNIVEEETGIASIQAIISKHYMGVHENETVSKTVEFFETPLYSCDSFVIDIPVPHSIDTGEYGVYAITLIDKRNNMGSYYQKIDSDYDLNQKFVPKNYLSYNIDGPGYGTIPIINDKIKFFGDSFDLDLASSSPFCAKKIGDMEDGKTARIQVDSSNKTIIDKEVFDVLRGTNKNLKIQVSSGVEWLFKGRDITKPSKNVDCDIKLSTVDASEYGTKGNVLKVEFKTNGILPGKATIRLKSDLIYKMYKLSNKLYLYYLNKNQSLALEDNPKYIIDKSDHWCEFDIDHNSSFIITGQKLQKNQSGIRLNYSSVNLKVNQTKQLKVLNKKKNDSVKSYKSSNKKVASISSKGKITAKKKGTCTITVIMKNGKKLKCQVKVLPLSTKKLKFTKKTITIKKGKTLILKYRRYPKNAGDKLTWSSTNPQIVKVTSKGRISALKKGISEISVKSESGKQAKCIIKVK